MFARLGVDAVEVRSAGDFAAVDALVIPGGESTTIGKLAEIFELMDPIRDRIKAGMPVLGTCAGMIVLSSSTTGKAQPQLCVLDAVAERNAFGRQVDSFEDVLDVVGFDQPMRAVFIRAPWIHKVGADVEVLATTTDPDSGEERPVFVRQDNVLAISFHPELTEDARVHEMLLDMMNEEH